MVIKQAVRSTTATVAKATTSSRLVATGRKTGARAAANVSAGAPDGFHRTSSVAYDKLASPSAPSRAADVQAALKQRSSGLLVHISSLPGRHGIGDLSTALGFVDFLKASGQKYWQMLPLGPNSGSPYSAISSKAGDPLLVALEPLEEAGDLTQAELASAEVAPSNKIDLGAVWRKRNALLPLAAERFFARASGPEKARFDAFVKREGKWLDDYALFAATKKSLGGKPWWQWPKPLAMHKPAAIATARSELKKEIMVEQYTQFRFFEQLGKLREKLDANDIDVIGDLPIYVARDSVEVWSNPELFQLDKDLVPTAVAGVPPDYFSADGQLWGMPLYNWKALKEQGFKWWIDRLQGSLGFADVVRLDHFRAFESYWAVPAGEATARNGRWEKGPGDDFFKAVKKALGGLPFIAEDLGEITQAVRDLRDRWGMPGMGVAQFGFGKGNKSPHLPQNFPRKSVGYTGTQDNDTSLGWAEKASSKELANFWRHANENDGLGPAHEMIEMVAGSQSAVAMVPIQDALGLGSKARTNTPGTATGNWAFMLRPNQLTAKIASTLKKISEATGRTPKPAIDVSE